MKSLTVLALSLCTAWAAFAQNVTVKGIVTDEQNEPMIAAGVVQKGTTNGTITDVDGSFTLSVPKGATVVFSTIGYVTQEVVVNGNETLTIKLLPDTQMIEETVVVGYGVLKKSDVTGAISQVKSEDIMNRTITSPEQALGGKTAGVQTFAYQYGRDMYVARSAETYLLLAEAYLRNGDMTNAVSALNTVRQRAQASYMYSAISMRDILDERARELAYEEHRWPTLLRLDSTNGTNEDMKYQLSHYTMYTNDCGLDGITPEWTLFPIPLTVINLNSGVQLEQNKGWN